MITHLFKLIWNKKKQNFLLILEMFISFLVMFAVFSLIVYYFNNYRKTIGFEYENAWTVSYNFPEMSNGISGDSAMMLHDRIKRVIKPIPGIVDVTFASPNIPFSFNTSNGSIERENRSAFTHFYQVEDNYLNVLQAKLVEGRFFSKADDASKDKPIVINEQLKEDLFGNENAIGKRIGEERIIGIIGNMKDKGDFEGHAGGLYRRIDTGSAPNISTLLIRVSPDATADTENRLYKALSKSLRASNVEIEHLTAKRARKNNITLVPMIVLLIVAGFLIINVALGLFGVLWYNINMRRSEIGLRRAIGATGHSISRQLIGESLILSTLAILLGCFFAVQFPLLDVFDLPAGVYISAILLSVLFIYLLVIVCAVYPGKQAAAIYPAVALHEE